MNPAIALLGLLCIVVGIRLVASAYAFHVQTGADGLIEAGSLYTALKHTQAIVPSPLPDCDRCLRLGRGKREATIQAGALNYCQDCWDSLDTDPASAAPTSNQAACSNCNSDPCMGDECGDAPTRFCLGCTSHVEIGDAAHDARCIERP